jgi:hypothetical protein
MAELPKEKPWQTGLFYFDLSAMGGFLEEVRANLTTPGFMSG